MSRRNASMSAKQLRARGEATEVVLTAGRSFPPGTVRAALDVLARIRRIER